MIDQFDIPTFEDNLNWIVCNLHNTSGVMWRGKGILAGEYVYDILLDKSVSIRIRSSIREDQQSASVGEDSIRLWLVEKDTDVQLSKLDDCYTTRVAGWHDRLRTKVQQLMAYRTASGDCPECKHPLYVYRSKTEGKNKGRLFTSCFQCRKTFRWLEASSHSGLLPPSSEVYFSTSQAGAGSEGGQLPFPVDDEGSLSQNASETGLTSEKSGAELVTHPEPEDSASGSDGGGIDVLDALDAGEGETDGSESPQEAPGAISTAQTGESASTSEGGLLDALDDMAVEEEVVEESAVHTQEREPNAEQSAAIYADINGSYRVLAPPGSGKCLGKGTPVLLYDGTVIPVEQVRIGMRLMGVDSLPRTVLSLGHGFEEMFRITPTKGDSYVVNKSHMLSLRVSGTKFSRRAVNPSYGYHGDIVNISVADYLAKPKYKQDHFKGWRIGVDFSSIDVMLDPYFLGLWLGDGHKHKPSITTADKEILDYLITFAYGHGLQVIHDKYRKYDYHLTSGNKGKGVSLKAHKNPVKELLKDYAVLNNKHIPKDYLANNKVVRLGVLAGLIDSDGYIHKGCCEITQVNKRLAKDILYLARSLGFAAYASDKVVNGVVYHRINISGNLSIIPVLLKRKQVVSRLQKKDVLRTGIKCESIGVGEYFGFELDGDGLFLLGDFTVTHNTFLLIRRIRYLLQSGVNMANILAVTFTGNMANELFDRLVKLMPEMENNQWSKRNISTIHASCYRMLKDVGDKRRYPDREMWKIKQFIQDLSVKLWENEEDRPAWKEILDWIYTAKSHGLTSEETVRFFYEAFPQHAKGVARIYEEYESFMRRQNWLLFGDMLYDVERKLETDPIFRKRFQTLYKYILVDEGQDTSGQAMRILTKLAAPQDNFFIVGDTDQLLYRFAGATPEDNLYEGFEQRFPEGKLLKLVTNYRSTRNIIRTCNELILNNYTDQGGPYENKYYKDVSARADADIGDPVEFALAETPESEGFAVTERVKVLLGNGYTPGDIFIGSRTRAQLAYLEPWLMKEKIPFINIAGISFWDSRHIQDMIGFLKVASNPYDQEAFGRVYNIASNNFIMPWGDQKGEYCSHHFLPRIMLSEVKDFYSAKAAVRAYRFPYKYSWKAGLEDMVELVNEVQYALEGGVAAALNVIVNESYLKFLVKELGLEQEGDGGMFDDIQTLIAFSGNFKTAAEFLNFVDEAREQAKKAAEKDWSKSVILSTIHRLKGLERKVVIGIGVGEGTRPSPMGDESAGLLPHTFSLIPPPSYGILPGSSQGRVEDERCVAFVLVSRAMEKVYLYAPVHYQDKIFTPSRFVQEMGVLSNE